MSEGTSPPMTAEQWTALSIGFRVWAEAIQAQNAELWRAVAELRGRVAELEAELRAVRKTPQNSAVSINSRAAEYRAPSCQDIRSQCGRRGGVKRNGSRCEAGQKKAGRAAGASQAIAAAGSRRAMR